MIYCYNPKAVGDVLLAVVEDDKGMEQNVERKGNIARIYLQETNETVGWNFFSISEIFPNITRTGQLALSEEQVMQLNAAITAQDFRESIEDKGDAKIIVGSVVECQPHPDSDHLSVTQLDIGDERLLQVVCGAANIRAGLKVAVAKPGAMMPNGLIIWPGKLRGVESFGMICSATELGLPPLSTKPGILELTEHAEVGQDFYTLQEVNGK